MSLVLGQNVSLLCKVLCEPDAAASDCHHRGDSTDSPQWMGDHDCDAHTALGAAFIKEDGQLGISAQDVAHAIVVQRYQLASDTADARVDHDHWRSQSLETRPLNTALRI